MASKAPLHIYQFDVFGEEDVRDYGLRETPTTDLKARQQFVSSNAGSYSKEMLQYDLANIYSGAKVAHVSSKSRDKNVSYMIDGDPDTRWTADKSDKESLVLLDLENERRVSKMSVMHSSRPGKILAYVLSSLPSRPSKPSQLAWLMRGMTDVPLFRFAQNVSSPNEPGITSEWLDTQTPFASLSGEDSNFSTASAETQTSRYLLLRYLNSAPGTGEPLMINSINVLGDYSPEHFVLMPRSLPIVAAGGKMLAPPAASQVGVPIAEQLRNIQIQPPSPPPASP
jgi:hypothetical protein